MTPSPNNPFIDQLVSNCRPVCPPCPIKLFFIWLTSALVTIVGSQILLGVRGDLSTAASNYSYCASLVILALGACLSAWTAIKISIPGEQPSRSFRIILPLIPIVLALGISLTWFISDNDTNYWSGLGNGLMCSAMDLLVALVPLLVLSIITANLAPLRPFITSVFVAMSALFTSAIAMQLHCSCNLACHMTFSHYLPIFFGSLLIALPMQIVLDRWKTKNLGC